MSDGTEKLTNGEALQRARDTRFGVAGDVVNRATADLPDDQRSEIRWLHAHATEKNLNLAEVAEKIRYDESTISRVFHGKYEGKLANVAKEIRDYRLIHEERSKSKKIAFVTTELAEKIWKLCGMAVEYQRISFIFGDTQIGKSEALLKFRDDHNHGSTIYVSMPTGGALGNFLAALARALRIPVELKDKELIRRILLAFDDRMLLIVDEAHQCFLGRYPKAGARTIEFIRELFDARKCGVVICGTNVFREEMETGVSAGVLKQTKRRRLMAMQLPGTPSAKDLNAFAAAFHLPPARGEALVLQTEVIREEALGFWITLLRMAAKLAAGERKPLNWQHVIEAHAGLKELEGGAR